MGWELSGLWRLSTPMSGDRGPRAHHGRHPWGRGPPCLSWWLTLFSHRLFFSGGPECSLPPGGGRLGGQAHCTHKGGWTRVHSRLLWDRLAGGPGLWNTGHSLLWDCSCPAPGRAVGWTGPALGGLGLCWGRQKLSKRARGRGPGSRPGWGPPTPGTNRGRLSSVNARVGGWVLACRDRPGAREAPWRDPGRLEPEAEWAVERQPWTLGLSQEWGGLVGPHVCFMSAVSPAEAWLPAALSAWTASCVWNCGCDLRERSSRGACPPLPPAFGGSVWGDAAPGGSVSREPRGGQGLRGCPAWQD